MPVRFSRHSPCWAAPWGELPALWLGARCVCEPSLAVHVHLVHALDVAQCALTEVAARGTLPRTHGHHGCLACPCAWHAPTPLLTFPYPASSHLVCCRSQTTSMENLPLVGGRLSAFFEYEKNFSGLVRVLPAAWRPCALSLCELPVLAILLLLCVLTTPCTTPRRTPLPGLPSMSRSRSSVWYVAALLSSNKKGRGLRNVRSQGTHPLPPCRAACAMPAACASCRKRNASYPPSSCMRSHMRLGAWRVPSHSPRCPCVSLAGVLPLLHLLHPTVRTPRALLLPPPPSSWSSSSSTWTSSWSSSSSVVPSFYLPSSSSCYVSSFPRPPPPPLAVPLPPPPYRVTGARAQQLPPARRCSTVSVLPGGAASCIVCTSARVPPC